MSDPEFYLAMASAPSQSEHIKPDLYRSTATLRVPLTPEKEVNAMKPKVLISGSGIGGLTLGKSQPEQLCDLKAKKILPQTDNVPLPYSFVCLVGQTKPLDAEEFPHLKLDLSQFITVNSKEESYSWVTFTTKKWGPEAAETMCKQVQHFKVPGGKDGKISTIGDLIDRTPKDLISKLNPAAGAGAVSVIHDAVTLASWIVTLK
ncbi:hypothetical protein BG006_001964 [Podila minutissima]|uniref:Uncharacterized protein n=1 Tax=Podila minutissima TaxID=64525 RepID=A0A9P5SR74_9FUNG|nr:hypothetical protein BG006_001964 [Podila minutissima]